MAYEHMLRHCDALKNVVVDITDSFSVTSGRQAYVTKQLTHFVYILGFFKV